ncbi:MAG: hypothetical protein GY791_06195 [Alphaproteobacteria bacterium]|nr:hypothetical protein [Alphaproteobacteria bacterium]
MLGIFGILIAGVANSAQAGDEAWKSKTIADALLAAPPSVTHDATIFGWSPAGELILARYGSGTYTCIASGSFSIRLGKPALPYPDPICLDQNSWAFLKALWSVKSAGNAGRKLPTAPGLVWMLAGMNVSKTAVDVGASGISVSPGNSDQKKPDVYQMTPHVMIMPLPASEHGASLTTSYNPSNPFNTWIMAVGKPHEHLMVHFSAKDTAALMQTGR